MTGVQTCALPILQYSLLGHDERNTGAVGLERRGAFPSAEVEHGQGGQGRGDAASPSHTPQLAAVAVDGVVVVELYPAAGDRGEGVCEQLCVPSPPWLS